MKGCQERSRCLGKKFPGVEGMQGCRGWCSEATTLLTNLEVSSTLRRLGGGIPANTGRHSVGVGWRHPVMMRIVSLRATSNFLVCLLRHQAGTAYSAALYATAKALMQSVDVLAPHEVPAKHLIRLFLAETLEHRPSKCCR